MKTKVTKPKRERRKRGQHHFRYYNNIELARCITCGCDEDDAFVGGQECSYGQKPDWKPE